jgi:aryl-alcohol dehydrogenase-like predicted oxidoreductase
MIVVVQSYTRIASLMAMSLHSALRKLRIDYTDFLLLGWWNHLPPPRILDAAERLREQGKLRHILISGHERKSFPQFANHAGIDAVMVRYNAAHTGAESEVFPHIDGRTTGVLSYTATRWGSLLDPTHTPAHDPVPRASDCYRFVLSNPSVQVAMAGPRDGTQLDEAMSALDRGPMSDEELAWMRRVGQRARTRKRIADGGKE